METINQAWLAERGRELQAGILFLTRLRYGAAEPVSGGAIGRAAWAFPIVGVVVGLVGAVVYGLGYRLGLPFWPAAALCVAATMILTGCLHEDGFADTFDGFGGGETRERKLDIMRDSRIGTYGVCALIIAVLLRVSALALIGAAGPVTAALIAAHAAGRAVMPAFMALLPPARSDGLSAGAGQPPFGSAAVAAVLGVLILFLCLGLGHGLAALIVVAIAAALMGWLSANQIGGQTGDVLGAVEQVGEIVVLLVALC
jgi:adenosylcobinamide-GDP ribazoletransferase